MIRHNLAALVILSWCAAQGCNRSEDPLVPVAQPPALPSSADSPDSARLSMVPGRHQYTNRQNRLTEGPLAVIDGIGKPATRGMANERKPIENVSLKIVWTCRDNFGWNYVVPELHDPTEKFGISDRVFMQTKSKAQSVPEVHLPDSPYSFFLIDSAVSPYFRDSEKGVIWKFDGLDAEFSAMRTINASSNKFAFTAPGGDMAEILTIDFADREKSPAVTYYIRFDGP